jgi:hypothetical protein
MKRSLALAVCAFLWCIYALVEGLVIPFAVVYVWANEGRRVAGRCLSCARRYEGGRR